MFSLIAARSPQPAARSPQPAARSPQPAARSPFYTKLFTATLIGILYLASAHAANAQAPSLNAVTQFTATFIPSPRPGGVGYNVYDVGAQGTVKDIPANCNCLVYITVMKKVPGQAAVAVGPPILTGMTNGAVGTPQFSSTFTFSEKKPVGAGGNNTFYTKVSAAIEPNAIPGQPAPAIIPITEIETTGNKLP